MLPTDTVYGLVASATDIAAVRRLYAIKHREKKPGTLIAANTDQLVKLGLNYDDVMRVAHLWPAAISVVLPAGSSLKYLHEGLNSLAVRIPADQSLLQLLQTTGVLLTSSANPPGAQPAEDQATAIEYFGEDVDGYVAGFTAGRKSSTVVKLLPDGKLAILRQGDIAVNEL